MGWFRLENWPVTWIGLVSGCFQVYPCWFQGVSVLVPGSGLVPGWFRVGGSGLVPGWKIDLQPGLGWFRVGKFQPIATSSP